MKENSQHIVNQLKTDLNIELKAISNWWVNAGFDKINHTFYAEVDNENTPNLDADFILIQSARLL